MAIESTLWNDPKALMNFANGIVRWEYNNKQIEAATKKIWVDKADLILDMIDSIGKWSWSQEIINDQRYAILPPAAVSGIIENLSNWKAQADQVANDDNFKLDDLAIPLVWAGTIGWIYWLGKGIGKVREYIPITNRQGRDISNRVRWITRPRLNSTEAHVAWDKRVQAMVEWVQNMSKSELKELAKKWYRWLSDRLAKDAASINKIKQSIMDNYEDKFISRQQVLWELDKQIEELKKTNPSRAKWMERVSKEYHKVFDDAADEAIKAYEAANPWVTTNSKWYATKIQDIKKNMKLPLKVVEGIKEWAYTNYDDYDQLVASSAADAQAGEWYRVVGKSAKKALEEAVWPELQQINQQYAKIKSIAKGIGREANKALVQPVASFWRKLVDKISTSPVSIPFVRENNLGWLSNTAREEAKLPTTLENIRKWGDKIIKTGTSFGDDVAKAVNTVANTPWVKQVLGAWKKILKVAWPAMEAFGWFNPAQSIQDALNKWGAIVPSSGKLTPMKQA